MNYRNGKDVLPPELLDAVQEYLSGELLYIPKKVDKRLAWGQLSGSKNLFHKRNNQILERYHRGAALDELTEQYCLSESSIRKIIYAQK